MVRYSTFLSFGRLLLFMVTAVLLQNAAQSQPAVLDPLSQPQFVNPLPIPQTINARSGGTFTITVSQTEQDLGLVDPVNGQHLLTKVWGYNGTFPGPTILARKNVPVQIYWINGLINNATNQPLPHLLPVDETIEWAFSNIPNWKQYGVPIVTHVHGGHTESVSDGSPDAWFTPFFTQKGPAFHKGQVEPYYYSNDQDAATLWYHDHAFGITRLNVYAGMAGYYLLTDELEQQLKADNKLPADQYDIGLAIQDRMFTANGQLYYPAIREEEHEPEPSVLPEFFGNIILVNGKAWPVLEVEPRQYRFRILDGSDSRFYNLYFSSSQPFWQIGTDQGFLSYPVQYDKIEIGPGQRKDVIVDFSDPALWGQTIVLKNNARSPFPKGTPVDPRTTGRVMAFKVTKPLNTANPKTVLPRTLRSAIHPLTQNGPTRQLVLFESEDEYGRLKPMLGTVSNGVLMFKDEITENIALNSTEVWEIYNATEDAHPIHLHLVKFQALSRQKYFATVDQQTGKLSNIRLVGQAHINNLSENGWKDTELMFPGEVTRLIATFDLPGLYEWHCHILSHEDHEMMRPFLVGTPTVAARTAPKASIAAAGSLALKSWPNPFRYFTQVQFTLTAQSFISLNIYDMQGRKLQQLFSGIKEKGQQQFTIDTKNWSNGIYFCEVTINGQQHLLKLISKK